MKDQLQTPTQREAHLIVHAGLADVRAWLGETTSEQAAGDAYTPRHGKTVRSHR